MSTLPAATLPERAPRVGELVHVRSRRWLVEEVVDPPAPGESSRVRLACAAADAQGQSLEVFWGYEIDRWILEEEGWAGLAAMGFDPPRYFAAFFNTLRWHCTTATDSSSATWNANQRAYGSSTRSVRDGSSRSVSCTCGPRRTEDRRAGV